MLPGELFTQAAALGLPALGVVDRNNLSRDDLAAHAEGLLAILVPGPPDKDLKVRLDQFRADFRDRTYLALTLRRRPGDAVRLRALEDMARAARVATVATGDVL